MKNETLYNDYEIELEVGENYHDVSFDRTTVLEYDGSYGADADGRRGVVACFIDSDTYCNVHVDNKPLSEYSNDFQIKVSQALDHWLIENEAE